MKSLILAAALSGCLIPTPANAAEKVRFVQTGPIITDTMRTDVGIAARGTVLKCVSAVTTGGRDRVISVRFPIRSATTWTVTQRVPPSTRSGCFKLPKTNSPSLGRNIKIKVTVKEDLPGPVNFVSHKTVTLR